MLHIYKVQKVACHPSGIVGAMCCKEHREHLSKSVYIQVNIVCPTSPIQQVHFDKVNVCHPKHRSFFMFSLPNVCG